MLWLIVAVIAYFFLAISVSGDKFLLVGGIPNPKTYTFYVGILVIFLIALAPFGFFLPSPSQISLAFLAGVVFTLGIYLYYSVLKEFDVSRVAPAIGGMVPIFSFLFIYIFSGGETTLNPKEIISFLLLVLGSVLIVADKSKGILGKSFLFSLGAAFYFALYFVLAKFVYDSLTFINGLIWIRIGGFLVALLFLFSKEVRSQIFTKPKPTGLKTAGIFIANQIMGGVGSVLQNWAIALAPLIYIAFINALQGVQYVFLFIFSVFLSLKLPRILKEEMSRRIIFQKIIAILLIGAGLTILAIQ